MSDQPTLNNATPTDEMTVDRATGNAADNAASSADKPRCGIVRRMYDWVLSWADTPYGTPALAVISFAESSFFPIPPDVLQLALSVSKPKRAFFYATVSAIFSVLGAILGWYIGYALWGALGEFFTTYVISQGLIDTVEAKYQGNAFLVIFGAAFSPIPFKVFTIAAGIFHIGLPTLLVASAIGRSARFYLVATCIYFFGPSIKDLIDRYFGILTLLMFVLLVGGFAVVKCLMH